jgi:hypothetical protein
MIVELQRGKVVVEVTWGLVFLKFGRHELCWAKGQGLSTAKRWLWVGR